MTGKHFGKTVTAALAVILLFSILIITISVLDDTVASARVTQGHINRLRNEKREYERQKREIQEKIDAYEFERLAEMTKKQVLDERIMLTGLEIENTNEIIEQYIILIREKEYEVVLAQNRENTQLQKYRSRVRDMEENGVISYLEIVFDSTSFSDLLARIDFVGDIMRADETLYNNLQDARNETEAAKEDLELTKEEMEEEKVSLELKEAELQEQLEEAHELILKLEADIETEQELRADVAAEEERVQKAINAAVAELQRQQERDRQRRAGGSATGTGRFMWPVGGTITSRFGMRNGRMHSGVDIAAGHGTTVVAADSGTVITSTYSSSYGNYIVISHGGGVTTLYAHLSSRSVSAGSTVSKGQAIGRVGSTGVSTGPHLHFEMSIGGSKVNPLNRL